VANGAGHTGHRWRKVREEVLAPRPLYCWFCGQEIDVFLRFPHPGAAQVHCKIPVSRGGTATVDNGVPAHAKCNQDAGNRIITEFIHVEGLDP
jgi:5-methylcytosine-specific restriction endonuclease McrA